MTEPQLDFSRFHPLDHWPWQDRCRQLYGGPRNHLHLAWTYRHQETLLAIAQRLRCVFGFHDMVPYWQGPLSPMRPSEMDQIEPSGWFCSGYRCRVRA